MHSNEVIWVSIDVVQFLLDEGNKKLPNETGGVLVGWVNETGIIIYGACGPGDNALHKPRRFCPDQNYRSNFISDCYTSSNGRLTYLGDWHTHPQEISPNISFLDRRELYRMEKFKPARFTNPIMLILGLLDDCYIKCWTPEKELNFWPWDKTVKSHEIKIFDPTIFSNFDLPEI